MNDAFEKVNEKHQKSSAKEQSDEPRRRKDEDRSQRSKDTREDEETDDFNREPKEYTQNFENGRALRDSQLYRDSEMQKTMSRDSYKMDHRMEMPRVVYKAQDIYQRPVDEIDTPRFPVESNRRSESMFAKIVNPSVKIMKVERDVDEAIEGYRYSYNKQFIAVMFCNFVTIDALVHLHLPQFTFQFFLLDVHRFSDTSQYDNVPIRMRSTSPKNQKKSRDVSFNVPPPPVHYGKDEIEMLEECFTSLRTASTGTQTPNIRTPSSAVDPGYVKHTASNWPQESRMKTPGSSPNRARN